MNKRKKRYLTKRNDGTPSRKKFLGFDFYIQCNGKLSRKNRKKLLTKSEDYLGSIYHTLPMNLEEKINEGISDELDGSLTDLELLEFWNPIYEKYGYLIPDFKDKWEKKYLQNEPKSQKVSKSNSNFELFETRINQLEFRIKQLELKIQLNPIRFVESY